MGTPVLRPLQAADLAALADLWVASWQETMPAIDFSARRDWLLAFLRADAGRETLVALDGQGAPCGFATLEPENGLLHQLAVAPAAKGRGVAAALLTAVKAMWPQGLMLEVNQANGRAVHFYEREKFKRVGAGLNESSGLATWRMRWAGSKS